MSSVSDLTRSVEQWSADVLLYGAAGMAVAAVCAWVAVWITTAACCATLKMTTNGRSR
ncbi:hypothetical protein [Candidatus Mycobacterium methanotrophicum]|uniref:Uncharacterized protein n=1 Tax=Candidatus Mycobacterium methanotrophicum TaxID=2943498 RepID=A0ABY4QSZ7_9MYCO|nr:hypothetical protein [Candidatus Mycobacterium methanotrophicum]UQX13478.1 hypothetical protein M5I08_25075 [Candidatus Mycobacterium methanotrophicum]